MDDLKSALINQKIITNQQLEQILRKPDKILNGVFAPYTMPNNVFNQIGVKLLTDGRTCLCDFDIESHKNTSRATHYFSPTGSNSNQGTEESPWKDLTSTLMTNSINNGDTLILKDGIYPRFFQSSDAYSKSINIIAQNAGNVIINSASSNTYEYTKTNNYTYTYQVSRSAVKSVLYMFMEDTYIPLKEKTSISDVDNTPFSFACISGVTYININGDAPTNNKVFLNVQYGSLVKFQPNGEDCTIYMEGLKFIGGTNGGVICSNTSSNTVYLYANNCKFYGAFGDDYDAVSLLGAYGYFVDCECAFAKKDGFNYHSQNGMESVGFELRCRGYCNGIEGAFENCNGSTQHGGPIIRIDGIYHDNYGPNVADVAATSKTININCVAFDSTAVTDGYGVDFIVQTEGAEMWCIGCRADFGNTPYNFYATSGTTMHMINCDYDTTHGGGTFDIQ